MSLLSITIYWMTDTLWIFAAAAAADIRYLPSDDVDVWGICVHRVLFFCLEIKSLNIPAMKRAQENSFSK